MVATLLEISYTIITTGLILYFLKRESRHFTKKKQVINWMLFGALFTFISFSWLYSVYPLQWLAKGSLQIVGILIVHLLLTLIGAVCFSVVAIHTHVKNKYLPSPLIFASTLVLAEVIKSLLITTLFSGVGTKLGFHFTASTLGNTLSTTPLIEFAYFGGTFTLTLVLGYIIYCTQSKKHFLFYKKHLLVILAILAWTHLVLPVATPREGTKVGIVTTNFKTPEKESEYATFFRNQAKEVHKLTLSFASTSPNFIVYPEDTRYLSSLNDQKDVNILTELFPKTIFIDSTTRPSFLGLSTVSFFYYPKGDKKIARGKEFLLPFNEYVPTIFQPIITFFVGKENFNEYERLHTFAPTYSKKSILVDQTRVGTLICSEMFSYSVINGLKNENPTIVFYQAHLPVFHNNPLAIMHLRSISKVAAAQLRTPVISSISGAPSYIISPYGSILRTIPMGTGTSTYTFSH